MAPLLSYDIYFAEELQRTSCNDELRIFKLSFNSLSLFSTFFAYLFRTLISVQFHVNSTISGELLLIYIDYVMLRSILRAGKICKKLRFIKRKSTLSQV